MLFFSSDFSFLVSVDLLRQGVCPSLDGLVSTNKRLHIRLAVPKGHVAGMEAPKICKGQEAPLCKWGAGWLVSSCQ